MPKTPEEQAAFDAKVAEYKGKVIPVLKTIGMFTLKSTWYITCAALGVALYSWVATQAEQAQADNVVPISKAA
jgi:hypothetical protein